MNNTLATFRIVKRFPEFALECEAALDFGVTAIFGPSGSGKSTLLNCIAGLVRPDEGEIAALGETLFSSSKRRSVAPEKRRFGYVFQDSALFPHMSVRDNIYYGYKLTPREHRKTEPDQLVELLRLSHLMDRGVRFLSGGERQCVALARALATSPRLLLLDEPLASLDANLRGVIIGYLKRVWRELQTPMLYVSHSISEVMALAHNTLVLLDGSPVVYGSTMQVLASAEMAGIADYATLENIVEAEVISARDTDGTATLRVGDAALIAPEVFSDAGESVVVSIRAGDIILTLDVPERISTRNVISAVVEELHVLGPRVLVYAGIGIRLVVEVTPSAMRELGLHVGQRVHLIIKTNSILIMDSTERGDGPGMR